MSDSKHPMNAVPALLEERRQYEAWLAALAARRETTPAHVFERVHADYTARLRRVEEQLSSQQQSIQDERASVQSRLTLLQAEERMRLDERAELELRMQVGELSGPDAITAAGAVDDALHQSATERAVLTRQLGDLDALLAQRAAETRAAMPKPAPAPAAVQRPPAPQTAAAPAAALGVRPAAVQPPSPSVATQPAATPAAPVRRVSQQVNGPAPTAGGSFDELAFLSTVVGSEAPVQTAASHARPQTPAPAAPVVQAPPAATAVPAPAAPPARSSAPTVQPMARLKPLTTHTPVQLPPAPRPSAGIIRDEPAPTSLLDGIGSSPAALGGERPLAANDPANTPIILRTSGSSEQSKTLRCAECGAMNYPTEWYCERCGAELAAL